ncbi:hypothetical protein KEG38_46125 [Polyangium jinanense]|uniref:hypothetical protein n=1 Tax=Polyangium jinanense TaxID=2829994 RepID=UPI00233FE7C2|nr:hypothetical protein [Polyangium jinanense]MDC3961287.1 hypothetical protein [Polyangium jinanense]
MADHVNIGYLNGSARTTMKTQQEDTGAQFSALAKAIDQAWLQTHKGDFTDAVREYQRVEAEFVARMNDNAPFVLETRRRIAEAILSAAHSHHPSFDVCREAWNNLVRFGFTNFHTRCMHSWFYADCCAYDEQPEEGLAVLEPLLAEIERLREEARATQRPTGFYENEIEHLGDLRDELLAQQRGELSPGRITRRMDEAYQPTPEEERIDELYDTFWEARRAVFNTYARSWDRSFADVAADYRRVEADIVARAGEAEAFQPFVLEVRQVVAENILTAACGLEQPFEACRDAWNELVHLGFRDFGEQCRMTDMYAKSCGLNRKPEEGLAVVEPLLAELEQRLDAELERRREAHAKSEPPTHEEPSPSFYRDWIKSLGELRDKLEAQRKGP